MNPYSPELNYFLAYQYCRSLGLQLVSFETKEKADSITQYLRNAGEPFSFYIGLTFASLISRMTAEVSEVLCLIKKKINPLKQKQKLS